ncbi:restriction endonuclease subunit S [Vibrio metoecus]
MASNLTSMRLADCMDAIIDYRGKTPTKTTSGIPLITAKIIKNGRIQDVNEYIAEGDYDAWMRRGIPKEGDVVLTTEAPLGEVAQLDSRKIALAQRVITLRGKKGVLDNDYLLYLLQSHDVQHQLDGRGTGSTVKGIKQSELKEIILSFPSINVQKRIAQHLKNIDNKITLNRQINQTLEQMAQTLFKSWFVDFDPVIDNALDADNPIPDELQHRAEVRKAVRESEGFKPLPEDVRQLFPDAFEESELGWVPKGWAISTISDMARINSKTWSKKSAPEVVEYVDLSNAKNGVILGTDVYVFDEAPSRARRILNKKDTIFGLVRPANRSYAFVDKDGLTGSTGFAVVTAKKSNGANFIYQLLTSDNIIDLFIRIADGAAYPAIKPDDIADVQFAMPSDQVLDYFELVANSYKERSAIGLTNNINLTALRDTLLPKLISGELRLDDIELAVEQEAVSAEQQNER